MTYTDVSPFFIGANKVATEQRANFARWNAEAAAAIDEWSRS
jgi:hypothetical protein